MSGGISLAATQGPLSSSAAGTTSRISLYLSNRHPLVGQSVRLHGQVQPAGRRIVRLFTGAGSLRTVSNDGGFFSVRWHAPRAGAYRVRAYASPDQLGGGARSPARGLIAFRPALASFYGPGLYGSGLACGGSLQPGTIGVANKTLPCGSKLVLRYGNRSIQVRVIDRGPYTGGREFDLTAATQQRLGFPSTGYVLSSR